MGAYSDTLINAVETELRAAFLELEGEGAAMLDAAGRNVDSDTKGSIYSNVQRSGTMLNAEFGAGAAHAIFVHEGRRPGKLPPYEPIERWTQKKLGHSPEPVGRTRTGKFKGDPLVQAIRFKIGREGTAGTPFLVQPFNTMLPGLPARLRDAGARALDSRVPG